MRGIWTTIKALGIGAGLMYLLDPELGAKRRAKLRREFMAAAVMAGDEADQLLVNAGHKLAVQAGRIRSQVIHAVTGNGCHRRDKTPSELDQFAPAEAASQAAAPQAIAPQAVAAQAVAACPMAESRFLAGLGGSLLVAYGLRTRAPWAVAATAIGVGLVIKAALHQRAELAPNELQDGSLRPATPQAPEKESRWKVAQP